MSSELDLFMQKSTDSGSSETLVKEDIVNAYFFCLCIAETIEIVS